MWRDLFTKQFAFNTDRDVSLHSDKLKQHSMEISDLCIVAFPICAKFLEFIVIPTKLIIKSFLTQQTTLSPPKVLWPSTGTTDGEWNVLPDISTGWIWVRWIGFFFFILEL